MKNTKQANGRKGEDSFQSFLSRNNIRAHRMPYRCEYDFDVSGQRVELKTAKLRNSFRKHCSGWLFNIQGTE